MLKIIFILSALFTYGFAINITPIDMPNGVVPSGHKEVHVSSYNGAWKRRMSLPAHGQHNDKIVITHVAYYDTILDLKYTNYYAFLPEMTLNNKSDVTFIYDANKQMWIGGESYSMHPSFANIPWVKKKLTIWELYNGAWTRDIKLPSLPNQSIYHNCVLVIGSTAWYSANINGANIIHGAASLPLYNGDSYAFQYDIHAGKWKIITSPINKLLGNQHAVIPATKPITEVSFYNGVWRSTVGLPAYSGHNFVVNLHSDAWYGTTILGDNIVDKGSMKLTAGTHFQFTFDSSIHKWRLTKAPNKTYNVYDLNNGMIPELTTPYTTIIAGNGNWNATLSLPAVATLGDKITIQTSAGYGFNVLLQDSYGSEVRMNSGETNVFVYNKYEEWDSVTTPVSKLKKVPTGLVLRGKKNSSYCDIPRGNVDGGYCQIAWYDLEPTQGNFNFSLIDNAIAKAKAYNVAHHISNKDGFKVLLRIRTGIYSPSWVRDLSGQIYWYFRDSSDWNRLPVFWESAFQSQYKNMMQALANRYDKNIVVGAVAASMCMTKHTEIMWNRTGRTEVNALNMNNMLAAKDANYVAAPYTNNKDFNCLKNQVRIHNNTWKNTPTIFGSHLYQVYSKKGAHTGNYNKTIDIFNYCTSILGKRCVVGNNSLLHNENNTDLNINKAVTTVSGRGYNTYYQTHVFSGARKSFTFDNLVTAVNVASSWGASMVELPMGWDCPYYYESTTSDKTTCTHADYKSTFLQAGRTKLKANLK